MDGGHINLKCSDFLANVFSSFNNLRNSDIFTDVTLVSDDNKKIQAHKLILSAGSEYFRDILSDKSHPHPKLCLDGVSSEVLACIIKYLYVGEVSVPQSSLQKFLKIANKLKCFGLIEDGSHRPEKSDAKYFDNEISHVAGNEEPTPIEDISLSNKNVIVDHCDVREPEHVDVKDEVEFTYEISNNIEDGLKMKNEETDLGNEISHIVKNKSEDPTFLNKSEIVNICDAGDHDPEAELETLNKASTESVTSSTDLFEETKIQNCCHLTK